MKYCNQDILLTRSSKRYIDCVYNDSVRFIEAKNTPIKKLSVENHVNYFLVTKEYIYWPSVYKGNRKVTEEAILYFNDMIRGPLATYKFNIEELRTTGVAKIEQDNTIDSMRYDITWKDKDKEVAPVLPGPFVWPTSYYGDFHLNVASMATDTQKGKEMFTKENKIVEVKTFVLGVEVEKASEERLVDLFAEVKAKQKNFKDLFDDEDSVYAVSYQESLETARALIVEALDAIE